VRDHTAIFNKSGKHVAIIGLNEAYGLWQTVIVQREELELFCANKEVAFAAWHDEFDPETGSRGQWQASDPMRAVLPAVHRIEPQNICH
jgi:hypothetical protein